MNQKEKTQELGRKQVELRQTREKAHTTRESLAHLMGVSVRTIARWENDPGKLDDVNYHRALSALTSRSVTVKDDTLDLSQIPSVELANELARRLEQIEFAKRDALEQIEAKAHFPSF